MAFLNSFERQIIFDWCLKSLQYFRTNGNIVHSSLFKI